jgi:hypothetical protein
MQLFSFSAYQLHQTPNKGSALQIHHRWLVALETMCSIHEHFIRSVWNVSVRNIFGKHKKVCWKYLFYLVYCNFMNSYSKDETFQLLYPRFISSHVYKKRRVPILSELLKYWAHMKWSKLDFRFSYKSQSSHCGNPCKFNLNLVAAH